MVSSFHISVVACYSDIDARRVASKHNCTILYVYTLLKAGRKSARDRKRKKGEEILRGAKIFWIYPAWFTAEVGILSQSWKQ